MHDRGESAGPCNDEPPSDDDGGSSSSSNLGVSSTRGSVSSSSCFLVRPWEASPASFDAMRDAVEARGRLLPYLYTALRAAHDEGLGLLRPLYYEHPEEDMAYLQSVAMPQYYLGPDMIVSPVVAQLDAATGLASQPLWVPPGTFLERATGLLRTGASSSSSSGGSSKHVRRGGRRRRHRLRDFRELQRGAVPRARLLLGREWQRQEKEQEQER